MNVHFITTLLLLCSISLLSQTCGSMIFGTQQQVDDFSINHPGCTHINGFLTIKESTPGSITNLSGLSQITSVNNLNIYDNSALLDLSGLDNLEYVVGNFTIRNNNVLNELTDLERLKNVNGELMIDNNPMLSELDGLDSLLYIGTFSLRDQSNITDFSPLTDTINIEGINFGPNVGISSLIGLESIDSLPNGLRLYGLSIFNFNGLNNLVDVAENILLFQLLSLSNFQGLDNLKSIGFALFVNNTGISSFFGLDSLEHIGGEMIISSNFGITDFANLNSLKTITGNLQVLNNNHLQNFNGLSNLTAINGLLDIELNNSLSSLEGLENVLASGLQSTLNGNHITIKSNNNLSICAIDLMCDAIDDPNLNLLVSNNNSNCDSIPEISQLCDVDCLQFIDNTFTGNVNGLWHNPNNWSRLEVPDRCTNVIIPNGKNVVVKNGFDAYCFTIDVANGALFFVRPSARLFVMSD